MKVVIPAKASSLRVNSKNWRPFFGASSLVDVLIDKLCAAGFDQKEIYVSSESVDHLKRLRDRRPVNVILRDKVFCKNETSLVSIIRSVTEQVPYRDEIAWAQCTSPTFNEYKKCLEKWANHKQHYDSLCVAYPSTPYSLIETKTGLAPIGWSFGENHQSSQELQASYTMPFAFSILTRSSIEATGYYVGKKTLWHVADKHHIDIDDMQDFEAAKAVYSTLVE